MKFPVFVVLSASCLTLPILVNHEVYCSFASSFHIVALTFLGGVGVTCQFVERRETQFGVRKYVD